jgi:hypothetical protein
MNTYASITAFIRTGNSLPAVCVRLLSLLLPC